MSLNVKARKLCRLGKVACDLQESLSSIRQAFVKLGLYMASVVHVRDDDNGFVFF